MLAELKQIRFPLETGLLIAFCIFLPLVEAPKNIAWLLYIGAWLANRAREREFGGPWDGWDGLFAAWIASGYLVAAFSGLRGSELGGAHELARYAVLGWLVKRGSYSAREMRWVLGALVISTVAGLAHGYWRIWSGASKNGALQLHSVGHVNHTAIYLAIMLGVCTSWLFARWQAWRPARRAAAFAVAFLLLISLVVTASRGAIGVGLAMIVVIAAAWWPRWRSPLIAGLLVVAMAIGALIAYDADVIRKQRVLANEQMVLSLRDGIWRMGLAAWERYPWFGVGMDNYSLITHDLVRAWRSEAGKGYDASSYVRFPHGHSLFVNALAERGTIGFAALAAVLVAWLASLVRKRPRPQDDDPAWLLWGASASAWIATVGIGTVNTTLHHEHGLLAALLLGLWLSNQARPRAS